MIARRGKVWWFDFTIAGQRFRGSCETTDGKLAEAFARQRHDAEYRRIQLGQAPRENMALAVAFTRHHAEVGAGTAYGEGAQRDHMRAIERILGGGTLLAALDDKTVGRLVQVLLTEKERAPATVNRHLATLQAVTKRAAELWGVQTGPWSAKAHRLQEPEGREVFLDPAQAQALLGELCGHARPIVALDLMTGLRKANVIGLDWGEVSLDMARLVLIQKGGKRHSVSLAPAALALLVEQQPDMALRRGPVFLYGNVACDCSRCRSPAYRGEPIASIRTAFATAARKAGVAEMAAGRLRIHDLRHTTASWLLAEGGDLKVVQAALGHRQIATTMRYVHIMPGAREKAAAGVARKLAEG